MRALLLFGIIFFGGTCIILADSGEKKDTGTDMIEDPPPTVDGYATESFNYGDDYNDTDDDDEARSRSIRTHLSKRHIRDNEKKLKNFRAKRTPKDPIKFLENIIRQQMEEEIKRRKIKLAFKIFVIVSIIFTCGALIRACARCLCKEKRRTVTINLEETVPSLSPEPNTAIPLPYPLPYPQQPGVYPLQQISNPNTASFQQNSPVYPMNPTSYSPTLNVPEEGTNRTVGPEETIPFLPTAPNPGQPFLYPPQPGVCPLQQVSNPSAASFQQNALPYPTAPTPYSPSQNA